jgi:hypothetical protein
MALTLAVTSGSTCTFVQIEAKHGHTLSFPPGTDVAKHISTASIGVLCDGGLFDRQGDKLWTVSFIFFLVSLTLGSCATALAWAVSIILPPTDVNWSWLSIVAALAAVMQVPVFVLIDVKPCNIAGNECKPSLGFFLLIASTVLWIGVTLLTQCLDPPLWAQELNAWRVQKRPERSPRTRPSKRDRGVLLTDHEYDEMDDLPTSERPSGAILRSLSFADGFRKWARRRKWASSPEHATQTPRRSKARDPAEGIPAADLAEMGSYYANSCNSRLLLKVLPNGKLPGDDQKSMASFGDLDSLVNLAEAERLELGFEPQSLSQPSEDVTSCTVQSSIVEESVPSEECTQIASDQETIQKSALTDARRSEGDEGKDETERQEVENNRLDQQLLFENVEQDESPRKKLAAGIRALTEKMKLDSIRRLRDSRAYFLIDDNNISKSLPLPPIEVIITTLTPIEKDVTLVTPSGEKSSPGGQNAFRKVFACVAGVNQPYSSSEDEPESIYYSGDEAAAEGMSSRGRRLESDDDDAEETSTLSTSSDSEDRLAEDDVVEYVARQHTLTLRSRRKTKLRSSSLCSLKSHPSLLDMTIDEETDLELRAFESSDDEKYLSDKHTEPYPITRTLSETDAIEMRRRSSSDIGSRNSDSFSTSALEGCLRNGGLFTRSQALVLNSVSRVVPVSDDLHGVQKNEAPSSSKLLVPSSCEAPRDEPKLGGNKPDASERYDDVSFQKRRGRSLSIPRRTELSSVYPLDDDSDEVKLMSWKEERMFKDGIHAGPVIVSDESSSEGPSRSERSVGSGLSNVSQKARLARVQRLQREATRRRAKTLEPPTNRRRSESPCPYSFLMDSLDLRLAQVARPDGVEYGPDEISL